MNIIVFIVFSYPLAAYARGTGNTSAIDGLLMLIIFGFFAYSIVKDSFRKKVITISILLPTFILLYFQVMPAILGSVLIIAAPLIGFALEPSKKSSSKENSSSSTLIEPTHFFSEPIKPADESLNSSNSDTYICRWKVKKIRQIAAVAKYFYENSRTSKRQQTTIARTSQSTSNEARH